MENGFWSRRRWLARLSPSFLIIAAWVLWIAYQGNKNHTLSPSRLILCYVAAFCGISLFFWGTLERHRGE